MRSRPDNDQQRATQMQIWAVRMPPGAQRAAEAAQQVADLTAGAAEQARAQQQIRDEWQRTADSIFDTIRKLRGDVASPAQSMPPRKRNSRSPPPPHGPVTRAAG